MGWVKPCGIKSNFARREIDILFRGHSLRDVRIPVAKISQVSQHPGDYG
ncbi:hypothetical protein DYBT9275_04572 [Dyadobacter sp. CECT 9275]|uniref:Uncharacterized protein n=1 Tax=Dyadobacter helix TaxID=2822344 RepID=A0A916JIA5_9BACT|nr:hypothetical protein DYBT9275_04572 [Dyadobacter sp. CECT 9275]